MAAATPVVLSTKNQNAFREYYRNVQSLENYTSANRRAQYELIDKEYQRETNLTEEHQKARIANRRGHAHKYQDITIPIVKPQVESAVKHQVDVFCTGYPMFKVVSSPEYIEAAMQMNTLITDQSIKGGWVRQLTMFFRDGFKYNFAPLEVCWKQEVTTVIETDLSKSLTQGIPKKVIWEGNGLTRLDPYNTFVDRAVNP